MSKTIIGVSGKIEITHWHVGDDIRILVYNEQGNSVYFVTDSEGAKRWENALRPKVAAGTTTIRANRAVAETTHLQDYTEIVCFDALFPQSQTIAQFNKDQVNNIIKALKEP